MARKSKKTVSSKSRKPRKSSPLAIVISIGTVKPKPKSKRKRKKAKA
jgi:hypothetical protein